MSDFGQIYEENGKVVYYYLLSLCRDKNLAEELTQETMCRAIMNIESFRGESKISVWLCQIAKNLYFEWQNKNKHNVPLDESMRTELQARDVSEEITDKDTAAQILQHLHELDEPYKEVFMLSVFGGFSLKDISSIFGKSESWARVTFYRAKQKLLERMR